MKILVIDDSKEDREVILTKIKKNIISNLSTDESDCLSSASKKIKENNYDLIILDLILPETDGLDTIKEINKILEKENKKTPIIILTGFEDYSIGIKAFELGIQDFLMKDEMEHGDLNRAIKCATFGKKNVDFKNTVA